MSHDVRKPCFLTSIPRGPNPCILDFQTPPAAAPSGPKWVGPSWAHVGGPKLGPSGWAQGGPKLGPSWSKIWIFSNTIFLRVFEKLEPDKGGHFQNTIFLRVFEKWDPDIFQKSQISKISFSGHSKNAHIKLNGFQWVFGGWGDAPFIFFMGRMGQKSKNGPLPSCLSTWVGQ